MTVVWIYDSFDYNFGIKKYFSKYLKENCCYCSDEYFSFKYFFNYLPEKVFLKLSG